MKHRAGNLFVISGPSGAGKTALCQRLLEVIHGLKFSVSYTTRQPRQGEINDIHYTFVDETKFRAMISDGEFVEWAMVHGSLYGTSKRRIESMINACLDVMLDIDAQGAKQIKEAFPDSMLIFILPPSMDTLKERLVGRKSNNRESIEERTNKAIDEIRRYKSYDYVIINDTFDDALKRLSAIIIAERAKISRIDQDWIKDNF